MSECIVLDARKVFLNASQAISKRERPSTQARSPKSLGRAMVGTRTEKVEGSWPLHRHAQKRSRGQVGGNPQAVQRGSWPIAKANLYVRCLPGGSLPSGGPTEMEGVYSCDN